MDIENKLCEIDAYVNKLCNLQNTDIIALARRKPDNN